MVFGQILPKINLIIWFKKIDSSQKEGKNTSQKTVTEDKVKERIERRKTGREGGNRNPCKLINSVIMK